MLRMLSRGLLNHHGVGVFFCVQCLPRWQIPAFIGFYFLYELRRRYLPNVDGFDFLCQLRLGEVWIKQSPNLYLEV